MSVRTAHGGDSARRIQAGDDLALRVSTLGDGLHLVVRQLGLDLDDPVDRLEDGVHRSSPMAGSVVSSPFGGRTRTVPLAVMYYRPEPVPRRDGRPDFDPLLVERQRLQVAVVDLEHLVGQLFEGQEGPDSSSLLS